MHVIVMVGESIEAVPCEVDFDNKLLGDLSFLYGFLSSRNVLFG